MQRTVVLAARYRALIGRLTVEFRQQAQQHAVVPLVELEQMRDAARFAAARSEEHTSELQSLMRISYAVFCLKKKKKIQNIRHITPTNQKQTNKEQTQNHHSHTNQTYLTTTYNHQKH